MATTSPSSSTITTDQQLAALSQFTTHIQHHSDHVAHHGQSTLYLISDTSGPRHDDDVEHREVRLLCL